MFRGGHKSSYCNEKLERFKQPSEIKHNRSPRYPAANMRYL